MSTYVEQTPDEIRRDIEETRAEMDETVDELTDRLQPRHVLNDLLELFQGREDRVKEKLYAGKETAEEYAGRASDCAGNAASGLWETMKDHPVPFALIGAGAALLVTGVGARQKLRSRPIADGIDVYEGEGTYFEEDFYPDGTAGFSDTPPYAQDEETDTRFPPVEESPAFAEEGLREYGNGGPHGTGRAGAEAERRSRQARRRARVAAGRTQQQIRRSSEAAVQTVEQHPLAVGVTALAAGLIMGSLLPTTGYEDEAMGRRAGEARARAADQAREMAARGRRSAQAAYDEALRQAEEEGLTPEQMGERAREAANVTAQAGKDAAEHEGMTPDQLKGKVQDVAEQSKGAAKEEWSKGAES